MIRKLNFWNIQGNSAEERALIAVELLREVTKDLFDVSAASAALLLKMMIQLYKEGIPRTRDVIERLEHEATIFLADRRLAEYNMCQALLRRLIWLQVDEERPATNLGGSERVIIYDLSPLQSVYLKTLYALNVLYNLYRQAMGSGTGEGLTTLLIAEEAENYVRPRRYSDPPSVGERIVNELRAYGVGVVIVSPDPEQVPPNMAKDAGAVVSLGYQGLPDMVLSLLQNFRYADITKLIRTTNRPRCYVYYDGRLRIRGVPKPYRSVLDLRAEIREEVVEATTPAREEPKKTETPIAEKVPRELRFEEEEEETEEAPEPRGGMRPSRWTAGHIRPC